VVFVPLAAIREPQLAAGAIAEALGLVDISASDLPLRARAACEGRSTFMVLDNTEQVAEVAPLVADLLASATTLRVLVTSRAPLRVRGEREYTLSPLAMVEAQRHWRRPIWRVSRPCDSSWNGCVTCSRAFCSRLKTVPRCAICRRLDGLPLALELVAPWLKMLDG
jgi:predicted ATPase